MHAQFTILQSLSIECIYGVMLHVLTICCMLVNAASGVLVHVCVCVCVCVCVAIIAISVHTYLAHYIANKHTNSDDLKYLCSHQDIV